MDHWVYGLVKLCYSNVSVIQIPTVFACPLIKSIYRCDLTVYKSESATFTRNNPRTGPEPETDLGSETSSKSDITSEYKMETDSEPETVSVSETDSEPEMASETETVSVSERDSKPETVSKPEMASETETVSETEVDTDCEVEMTSSSMFVEDMKIMWGDSSDLTLVCGNQQIPCHSSVLAKRSGKPYA